MFVNYLKSVREDCIKKLSTGNHKKFIQYSSSITEHPNGQVDRIPIGEVKDLSDALRGQIAVITEIIEMPQLIRNIDEKRRAAENKKNE